MSGSNGNHSEILGSPVVTDNDFSPPRGNPFPIVGVGASAGGLEAFVQFLSALPPDTGMAFVLVQHLDPLHESLLPELLAPHTNMPVLSVSDEVKIRPNHVYVIPPNKSVELYDGKLRLSAREPGLHLPIDIFFESLAYFQGSRAIGVVLSGNASDGSMGVRAIKAECGLTFAQDEDTARFGSMPRNAVSTGAIDYVLSPDRIAHELGMIAKHPYLVVRRTGDARSETLPEGDDEMRRIFALLRSATRVDFSRYKPNTIRRRIGRRIMVLHSANLQEYLRQVEENPAELRELYRDLLISVTSFFRDPDIFAALRAKVEETVKARSGSEEPIRVWIPGCATGEEVYSIAMLLSELLLENNIQVPPQLFGTDISDLALERARQGLYSNSIEEDVSPERLKRFFTKVESGYQISKGIREYCVFARHDVTADPPFSSLDLVSCRNLLIYLDQTAQRQVFPMFHYSLKPTGLLLLGSAESTAASPDLFVPVDQANKIYSRTAVASRLPLDVHSSVGQGDLAFFSRVAPQNSSADLQTRLERLIQNKYSPDGVLIDAEYHILQFRGHTSLYLDPSPGQATLNLLRMATESLVVPIRRAVQAAAESNAPVRDSGIELELTGERYRVGLEVSPIVSSEPGQRYFLVVFIREKQPRTLPDGQAAEDLSSDERVVAVERELNETRSYLRNISEQYEAHSEELRAANEEARSSNEELQSTNEELRTTKEELQSTNEELTTVNEELQSRNKEVNATNSDLRNLLSSISVPVLMLDSDLRVRRFNSAAGILLDLSQVDIGRPVGHIRGNIETPRVEEQIRSVIATLDSFTEELQDKTGRWYSLTIRPYRTVDDRISGAVITLQDIDPLKRGLEAAERARDYAEGIVETVRQPLLVLDADLRVQRATQAFYDTFLISREEAEGRFLYDLGNGQWNNARLRELIGAALFRSAPFHDFEVEHEFAHIGRRVMRLNGRRIPFPTADRRMLLLAIEDVTERREIAEIRFQRLFETAKDGIVVIDVESSTVQDVNPQVYALSGLPREDFVNRSIVEVGARLGLPQLAEGTEAARKGEVVRYPDLPMRRPDGSILSVDALGNSYKVGSQPVVQFNIRDVSERTTALKDLRESEQRLRLFMESVGDFAMFQMDLAGIIVTWNSGSERLLGWSEQEAVGQPAAIIFTLDDQAAGVPERELRTAQERGRAEDERWHMRKDGSLFFASGVMARIEDDLHRQLGYAKVMRDVTPRMEQEEQLRRSVSEKETLVREIHHRVKNNLQVIVSLLSMQSRYTDDAQVLAAFQEAESRLRAIAHIHERLYSSDDLSEIEFAGYVTGLAHELVHLSSEHPEQIQLELNVSDLVLDIERAIPLGLIANELILNCIKHGLAGSTGKLGVYLRRLPQIPDDVTVSKNPAAHNEWAELLVTDTGPGLPPGMDVSQVRSMGLRLVTMLVRQLHGNLEVRPQPGAAIAITFPVQIMTAIGRME